MDKQKQPKLKRNLSPLNAWALAFGCIIGGGAFLMPGSRFLRSSGPLGTAIGMLIAMVLMLIIAVNYHYMLNCYPREGGAFTYTKELFGRDHAFLLSWFLGLSYLLIIPLNASALVLFGRALFGRLLSSGFHYSFGGYDIYPGEILLAECILVIFGILSIRGIRFSGVMQTALAAVILFGILILAAAAVKSGSARLDSLLPLFSPHGSILWQILSIVMIAPWAFVGFDTISQAAEEFWFPSRRIFSIMAHSIIIGALTYITICTITAAALPEGYGSWVSYIEQAPYQNGLLSLPAFQAAFRIMGNGGLIVISMTALAATVSGIIGFYTAASRLFYSMASGGMLPGWFGRLGRYHTPQNAVFFIMGFSLIAPFGGRAALDWFVDLASLGAAIGYGYTSACAARQARREGSKQIQFTGTLGVILAVMFALLLLIPNAHSYGTMNREAYLLLAVWGTLGFVFYWKSFRKWEA